MEMKELDRDFIGSFTNYKIKTNFKFLRSMSSFVVKRLIFFFHAFFRSLKNTVAKYYGGIRKIDEVIGLRSKFFMYPDTVYQTPKPFVWKQYFSNSLT